MTIFLTTMGGMLYEGLRKAGRLPEWAELPDLPEIPGLPQRDKPPMTQKDDRPWLGYEGSIRTHRSPNFRRVRDRNVTRIVLHGTESSSAQSAIGHFKNPASQVSAHYIIGRDGLIYQMVDERYIAWHCRGANGSSVGIELVARAEQRITDIQAEALIALLIDVMDRHVIPRWQITGHNYTPGFIGQTTCPAQVFGGDQPFHLEAWLRKNFDPVIDYPLSGEKIRPVEK